MRMAVLSAFLALVSIAAPQPVPSRPVSGQPEGQQKPPDPPLSIRCAPDTTFQLGVPYHSAVVASGGTGVYRFAITGGVLPAGLSIHPATGTIGGTPTTDGTFSYTVQSTDSGGTMATTATPCTLQLPVAPPYAAAQSADPAGNRPAQAAPAARPPVIAQPVLDPAGLAAPRGQASGKAVHVVSPADRSFVLGAEDQIQVLIYGSAEFSGPHMIRPDGKITMPFLGDIMATGLSPVDLGNSIKEKLKKYIVDPDVSVQVTAINSKRFFIQGEVNKPGQYNLLVPTNVLEALVNAGGFRDFANQKKIVVMRATGERLNFNYKEVIKGKKMEQNVYLNPGDIIIVR